MRRAPVSRVWDKRVKSSTVFQQSMRASRTWDIPMRGREKAVRSMNKNERIEEITEHTFNTSLSEYPLEVIDHAKKHLDMEDELFGHAEAIEVGAVANLGEHVRDARSA